MKFIKKLLAIKPFSASTQSMANYIMESMYG